MYLEMYVCYNGFLGWNLSEGEFPWNFPLHEVTHADNSEGL